MHTTVDPRAARPTRSDTVERRRTAPERRISILEPQAGGPAERFAAAFGPTARPVTVFAASALSGFVLLCGLSLSVGLLITHVLAHAGALGAANRHVDAWLAAHRTPSRTEASLIGSIIAGGVVLPIVVASVAVGCAAFRKWRVAAFVVVALLLEVSTYRVTTLVIHEHRPRVIRLENLPVNASYFSGHTAASIVVYSGLALLLTSMFRRIAFRVCAWLLAVAIPGYVGLSRMYRGMHYPLDISGGAIVGIGTLAVVVFACRAAGATAHPQPDLVASHGAAKAP